MPVVQFIEAAATDPDVLAIKQTLYRIGHNSPMVPVLIRARENDKQVAVLVELKARFDEENNIEWARALEQAGVHVVYGLLGAEDALQDGADRPQGARRHPPLRPPRHRQLQRRARRGIYTDLGLFTCRPDIGADASELFNYLTGYSRQDRYRKLLVAPVNMRERARAADPPRDRACAGRAAGAADLQDEHASGLPSYRRCSTGRRRRACSVDLIVRGICCLRPGVPGLRRTASASSASSAASWSTAAPTTSPTAAMKSCTWAAPT